MQLAVPPEVVRVCQTLKAHRFQAYLVGGAIRDSLLGGSPTDWDITTDARPEEVEELFEKVVPTGRQFGTVTVILDGKPLEVTTMRRDGPYSDGRHPDYIVYTSELEQDLSRRDFTINAIAFDPFTQKTIDPFRGTRHLRKKLLVTVGDPQARFREDPLRMLRLLRFQSTLAFRIEKKTRRALPQLAPLMARVSPERILVELNKLLLGQNLLPALETFFTSGLLREIIPELAGTRGVSAGESHPYDLLGHSLTAAHFAQPILHLRWAALLHDLGKLQTLKREHAQIGAEMAEGILRRLRASNQLIQQVTALIAHHMFQVHPHSSEKALRRFLGTVDRQTALDLVKLRQADLAGMNKDPRQILAYGEAMAARFQEILEEDSALTLRDLAIDGHGLMEGLQLKPGPLVGQVLHYLLERVWEDPSANRRETLLRLAESYLESLPENQH